MTLPPLPNPVRAIEDGAIGRRDYFTDDQMREYAQAAVLAYRADAERYNWLRFEAEAGGLEAFVAIAQLDHIRDSAGIDAAIDKAMKVKT